MGEGIRLSAGGQQNNTIANAIIKEYLAQSGEISPDNFVEFVRSHSLVGGTQSDVLFRDEYESPGNGIAITIDEYHAVLFARVSNGSQSHSIFNYYACLLRIADNAVTVKHTLQFSSNEAHDFLFDKSFVLYSKDKIVGVRTNIYYVEGCIFTVNAARTAISWSGWTNLVRDSDTGRSGAVAMVLKKNRIAVAYNPRHKIIVFAATLTDSGFSSIGAKAELATWSISSTTGTDGSFCGCAVDEHNVFVGYNYYSYSQNGQVVRCYVNDDLTITTGYTKLTPSSYANIDTLVPMGGKAVMVYEYTPLSTADDATYRTHASVVYVSGNGIGMSGTITLGEGSYSQKQNNPIPRAENVGDGYVAVMLRNNYYAYYTLVLVRVNGYSLSVVATKEPPNTDGAAGFLCNPALCGDHIIMPLLNYQSYTCNIRVQPFAWARTLKLATSRIDGIAETKATTSAKGKVAMINKWGV